MRNLPFLAILVFLASSPARAQMPAADPCAVASRPSFDVASIKASQSSSGDFSMRDLPDGIIVTGSLRKLIEGAYSLHDFQLTGGPDWIATSTWTIRAKNDAPPPDFATMSDAETNLFRQKRNYEIQSLIVDRFGLKCHMAQKEEPSYELVIAKGGPNLKASAADSHRSRSTSIHANNRQMHVVAKGIGPSQIASLLSNEVGRIVVDKSGLTGSYDLTLDWMRESTSSQPSDAPAGPTIFTALEEQLGLRLQPAKESVPVMVIDSVQKPSEN